MENKKDIGKAFREKLNHLEKSPNASVWNSINAELQKDKKRRIAYIPFWMKTAGVISLGLLICLFLFMDSSESKSFFTPNKIHPAEPNNKATGLKTASQKKDSENASSDKKSRTGIVDSDTYEKTTIAHHNIPESAENERIKQNSAKTKRKHSLSGKDKQQVLFVKKNKSRKNHQNKLISKNNQKKSNNKNTFPKENLNTAVPGTTLTAIAEGQVPAENLTVQKTDSLNTKIKKEKALELPIHPEDKVDSTAIDYSKLDVFVYGSPTHYGFITDKSSIDGRLDSNSKTSKIKFSYGLYVSYELTEKCSFRFGISQINVSYQTKNAPINTFNYSNISYAPNVSNASIYSQSNNSETMDIIQKLSYTELPLEVKYNFYNQKFGIGAITGLSYLFLNKNSVSVKPQNSGNIEIGKTKNLSDRTFSVNLGANFYYQFSEKLKLNVEPMIKYHLKDYEDAGGDLNPYTFGIQAGLQYSIFKITKKKGAEKAAIPNSPK